MSQADTSPTPDNRHESVRVIHATTREPRPRKTNLFTGLGVIVALALTFTGFATLLPQGRSSATVVSVATPAPALRLGLFANLTHAPALIAVDKGFVTAKLAASGTTFSTQIFSTGPASIEAITAGAIDAAYIGPNPAINSYLKSKGRSIVIVAGASSGGASLVVQGKYKNVAEFVKTPGLRLADQQLAGTQDVAMRTWLSKNGVKTTDRGGDAAINPGENSQTFNLFKQGKLDGAWVPEPWATRLVSEGGGTRLVDERDLWRDGLFPTTMLVVSQEFASKYPETVKQLVAANSEAINWLNANPTASAPALTKALDSHGQKIAENLVAQSLQYLSFNADPLAATYPQLLDNAVAAGLTKKTSANPLGGIVSQEFAPQKGATT